MLDLNIILPAKEELEAEIQEIIDNNTIATVQFNLQDMEDSHEVRVSVYPYFEIEESEWAEFVGYFITKVNSLY